MEYTIERIWEVYKEKQKQLRAEIYPEKKWYHYICDKRSLLTVHSMIEKELEFQRSFSDYVISQLNKHMDPKANWLHSVLYFKNKSEYLSSKIDFLNFYHTFLVFFWATLVLLNNVFQGIPNGDMFGVTGLIIVAVFKERADLRADLGAYKEVINIIDSTKEKL